MTASSPRPGAAVRQGPDPTRPRRATWRALAPALLALLACSADPIEVDGQFGRRIPLATGDDSPLPRLAFVDEGCRRDTGGCDAAGERACQTLLVDSLAPLTGLRDPAASGTRISTECLEIRAAQGLAASEPDAEALDLATARFRFDNLPLVRAPEDGGDDWTWTAGDERSPLEPGAVLGGNLLRSFAVLLRSPPERTLSLDDADFRGPTLTLYGEFPGSESDLADQGFAFLPLQFPGRLLGRELTDRCEVDQGRCEIDGSDISTSAAEIPVTNTRMVLDACMAIPPCGLHYTPSSGNPFEPGTCGLRRGPTVEAECQSPTDDDDGGLTASLVVATGVPGMVLFEDSAIRMFGDSGALSECPVDDVGEVAAELRACREPGDPTGVLHFAGWPSAGEDAPLTRIRVRSLALVPGATRSRSDGPCERAADRLAAMGLQCDRYRRTARITADIRNAAPPYSAERDDADEDGHTDDPGASALAVLGEAVLARDAAGPRPARWLSVTLMPPEHPVAQAVRRDVAPDAIEPDGLLGTALLDDTAVVLDYTDLNPAVRVACLEPHEGRCQVLPDCREDRSRGCCHGLPRPLLGEFIRTLADDTCCGALGRSDLEELQEAGHCQGVVPP